MSPKSFEPTQQRRDALRAATEATFDLMIIGGGIVGAGIARDAAMRGLRTALIDQHDFAFGTSSRSSRLLHGGLRYLAQGQIGLVREASLEKTILHRIAPHLTEPLPFTFPTYRSNKNWRLWQLKIGVKIYDLLCSGRNLGRSTWLRPVETVRNVHGLLENELTGAVRYYDAFTNDARLVLDTLRAASKAGAVVLNYCQFLSAAHSDTWVCELEDRMTNTEIRLRARQVVNATGPWANQLPHSKVKLRVTKGVHLVVDQSRLPVSEAVVMTDGQRVLFAIPWGERTILGTTDTDYYGSPEKLRADASDLAYVLEITNRFFPRAKLSSNDIISSWAGLRPLLADANGAPSQISRTHEVTNPEPGWWDVAGGKLTTYRLMAEQALDRVVAALGRADLSPCRTADAPLLLPSETEAVSGVRPPEFCRQVVEHYCTHEWAVHLDDIMIRRTSWHHYHCDASQKAVQVAHWMAETLGWNGEQCKNELRRYAESVDRPTLEPISSVRSPQMI